jgi:thiol:disulfide interchange protein DsbC
MNRYLPALLVLAGIGQQAVADESRYDHNRDQEQATGAEARTDGDTLRYLRRLSAGRELGKPQATPVPGIRGVRLDAQTLYVTEDGRYAFVGSLIDLKQGRNLTEEAKADIAREVLDDFGGANKVIFPADGKQLAVIDIFTDTSCPYCRKLHTEVPRLQAAGVTVRYLPYPRGGKDGPGYQGLRQVWCADDPLQAMDDSVHGASVKSKTACARADLVDEGYRLGEKLGLHGTPTIFLPDGSQVSGYVPAARLLPMLGIAPDKRTGG